MKQSLKLWKFSKSIIKNEQTILVIYRSVCSHSVDSTDNKYMNIKPCTFDEKESGEEDEQLEKAHLHDNVGDVVHSEQINAKWKDLFTNIHFAMDYAKATAFVDGKVLPDFANQPIRPYESMVVFIGKADKNHLKESVTKKHIQQEEKRSENCGK